MSVCVHQMLYMEALHSMDGRAGMRPLQMFFGPVTLLRGGLWQVSRTSFFVCVSVCEPCNSGGEDVHL